MRPLRYALAVGLGALFAACGARTGLPTQDRQPGGGGTAPDAGHDAARDVEKDVEPDVVITDCRDAGLTYIYVITTENDLYSFYPPNDAFSYVGTIACPAAGGSTPFSMGVDR